MKSRKGLIIAGLIVLSLVVIFLIAQPSQPATIRTQLNNTLPLPSDTASTDFPSTSNSNDNTSAGLFGLGGDSSIPPIGTTSMNTNVNTSTTTAMYGAATNANINMNSNTTKGLGMDKTTASGPEVLLPLLLSVLAGLFFLRRKSGAVRE